MLCASITAAPAAPAVGCPGRPVRLILPSPPGGGTGVATRMLTPKPGEVVDRQIVVENRGGASGNIGAAAARATLDGCALLAGIKPE